MPLQLGNKIMILIQNQFYSKISSIPYLKDNAIPFARRGTPKTEMIIMPIIISKSVKEVQLMRNENNKNKQDKYKYGLAVLHNCSNI